MLIYRDKWGIQYYRIIWPWITCLRARLRRSGGHHGGQAAGVYPASAEFLDELKQNIISHYNERS